MCGIGEDSKYPSFIEVKSLEGIGAGERDKDELSKDESIVYARTHSTIQ